MWVVADHCLVTTCFQQELLCFSFHLQQTHVACTICNKRMVLALEAIKGWTSCETQADIVQALFYSKLKNIDIYINSSPD